MKWILNELIEGTGARIASGDPATVIDGGAVDSRGDVTGRLFIGLPGEITDGGLHAPDALTAGAAAAVVGARAWDAIGAELVAAHRAVVVAADPLAILQEAGRRALGRTGATVVAITGSVGKTTTKDILVAMLRTAGTRVYGTPGNRNTDVGVPLSLLEMPADTEVAVVEMGMRGPGQIADLVALAPPHVACVTSVAPVHLEILGTIDAIAAAKAEILSGLGPGDVAVVPDDEPLLDDAVAGLPEGVVVRRFAGLPADVDIRLGKDWQRRNAAAAWECCAALGRVPATGTPIDVVLSAMRGQERPLAGGGVLIEDCYNANPIAMSAALRDLAARNGRRVAVLGDMMELGPEEARFHREVGELVSELGIDMLVAVGSRAAGYVDGAAGVPAVRFPDSAAAARGVSAILEPGDTVLVKASRGVALERVCEVLA